MLTDHRATHEYCPRESALSYTHAKEGAFRWISTSERLTYDIGNYLHHQIVVKLTASAVGDWECRECQNITRGKYMDCPKCGGHPRYQEMFFRSPVNGVIGSLDLVVDLDLPKNVIIEIKSVEKDKFKEMALPQAEHRQRVLGYLELLRHVAPTDAWVEENICLDYGFVLYISKGYGHYFKKKGMGGINERYSPFQEFVVRPEGGAQDHVEDTFKRAGMYWAWKNADQPEQLPPRITACNHLKCKRATKCIVAKECWNG